MIKIIALFTLTSPNFIHMKKQETTSATSATSTKINGNIVSVSEMEGTFYGY